MIQPPLEAWHIATFEQLRHQQIQVAQSYPTPLRIPFQYPVPDEPLDLPPNQPLMVQIQPLEDETGDTALSWIAAHAVDSDALPADLSEQHDHYLYDRPKKDPASRVVTSYFADTSFWIALSSRRDQYHSQTGSTIVTTEAVLWERLNALADASTRSIAGEGYRRAHADRRVEWSRSRLSSAVLP